MTMIEHVYRRTIASRLVDVTCVATCDAEIRDVAESFGSRVIMTSSAHQRASDRVAEAVQHLEAEIVVMVQGDEPMIRPEMIDLAVEPLLKEAEVCCVNLIAKISSLEDLLNPNTIKVVMDSNNNALYFSREAIPTPRLAGLEKIPAYKQVCIIPFRRDTLFEFNRLSPTRLEEAESIDMLRLLEHGYPVRLVESPYETQSVDTPQELSLVADKMRRDPFFLRYSA